MYNICDPVCEITHPLAQNCIKTYYFFNLTVFVSFGLCYLWLCNFGICPPARLTTSFRKLYERSPEIVSLLLKFSPPRHPHPQKSFIHCYLEVNNLTQEEVSMFSFRISPLYFIYVLQGVFVEGNIHDVCRMWIVIRVGFFVILMYVKYKSKYTQIY